jgi:hypothetical protein
MERRAKVYQTCSNIQEQSRKEEENRSIMKEIIQNERVSVRERVGGRLISAINSKKSNRVQLNAHLKAPKPCYHYLHY